MSAIVTNLRTIISGCCGFRPPRFRKTWRARGQANRRCHAGAHAVLLRQRLGAQAGGEIGHHARARERANRSAAPGSSPARSPCRRHARPASAPRGSRLRSRSSVRQPHIDGFMNLAAELAAGDREALLQMPVIGTGHVDEALAPALADQRIQSGQIDMVGDGDERAGIDVVAHGAGGAGQHHRFRAEQRTAFRAARASR